MGATGRWKTKDSIFNEAWSEVHLPLEILEERATHASFENMASLINKYILVKFCTSMGPTIILSQQIHENCANSTARRGSYVGLGRTQYRTVFQPTIIRALVLFGEAIIFSRYIASKWLAHISHSA
jgi:hypothetical protein